MNLLKVMDSLGLVKVQKGREGIMRTIKIRNRVYSPRYGFGTVIALNKRIDNEFCVLFDKRPLGGHDGYIDDMEPSVGRIPKEVRKDRCLFCSLLAPNAQIFGEYDVVKVEGTGAIPLKKPFLKVVDSDGNVVVNHVGVTLIRGFPYFVSLVNGLEDIAIPKTILGTPCLYVSEGDAYMQLHDEFNEENTMSKKDVRETSFA